MTDETQTDEQQSEMMAAFVEKMTPKLAETVMQQIDAKVEERLAGIASKNDVLLSKLHREKESKSSIEEQLAALTKQLGGGDKPTQIVLSKADARDIATYRAAKAQAEEAGIPLIIDRDA